jgi:hypothetical protein
VKKMMNQTALMTIAVLVTAGSAHATGTRARPEGVQRVEVERSARSAESAARSSRGSDVASTLIRQLDNSNIGRLAPAKSRDLQELMSTDADVRDAVSQILENSSRSELADLNAARIEALANLKGIPRDVTSDALASIDPVARAEQSFLTLALSASSKAQSWSPEVRGNLTFLMASANQHVANGKSRGQALLAAARDLESQKGVKLNVDDIAKLCK